MGNILSTILEKKLHRLIQENKQYYAKGKDETEASPGKLKTQILMTILKNSR